MDQCEQNQNTADEPMYVLHVSMYVRMHAWMDVCMYVSMHVCMYVYVCMHVCMYMCVYVHVYVYMHECVFVCMCVYVCMHVRRYAHMYACISLIPCMHHVCMCVTRRPAMSGYVNMQHMLCRLASTVQSLVHKCMGPSEAQSLRRLQSVLRLLPRTYCKHHCH